MNQLTLACGKFTCLESSISKNNLISDCYYF